MTLPRLPAGGSEMTMEVALRMRYPVKIKSLSLALVVAFLLGGIAAASASAAEFKAEPSFPVKFTASGGPGFLETAKGRVVTCTSTEGSGEVSGATEVKKVSVRFKGCFAEHVALLTCQSAGQGSGEIVTNSIKATPVDLNAGKTEAGLLLEPETAGALFAEFKCEFGPIKETLKVKGSIIGKVPNAELNAFRETLHLEFNETKGTPTPNQVEGAGEKHVLLTKGEGTEPFEFEESGIQEAVPGTTATTALEGKKIKLVP
jgi:hypothetical protein